MNNALITVLLVENDNIVAKKFQAALSACVMPSFKVILANDLAAALGHIQSACPDVVLLETALPDSRGDSSIKAISQASRNRLPVVVITDKDDPQLALRALQLGVQDFLNKSDLDSSLISRTIQFSIERKKLERRLSEQSEVLTNVLANVPQFVFWKDLDSKYLGCNATFAKAAGLDSPEDVVGRDDYELAWSKEESDSYRECDRRVMDNNEPLVNIQETQKQADGNDLDVLTSKVPLKNSAGEIMGILGIYADITGRVQAEQAVADYASQLERANAKLLASQQQLIQSEKMASIGQLAAGVAHDINNPVAFVMSNIGSLGEYQETLQKVLQYYAELEACLPSDPGDAASKILAKIRRTFDDDDLEFILEDTQNLLSETLDGAKRIKEIVLSLKSFARPGEDRSDNVDLNHGLQTTLKIVGNELKYHCTVHEEYGQLPMLKGHPGQLNQVFMNLLVNASHAIEEKGDITITTLVDQKYAHVRIADTGNGIAVEHLGKVFDPFFTTKPVGKGTGLGLSVSYGIVQQHGGEIKVESEPGKGTTFTVSLPLVGSQPRTKDASAEKAVLV